MKVHHTLEIVFVFVFFQWNVVTRTWSSDDEGVVGRAQSKKCIVWMACFITSCCLLGFSFVLLVLYTCSVIVITGKLMITYRRRGKSQGRPNISNSTANPDCLFYLFNKRSRLWRTLSDVKFSWSSFSTDNLIVLLPLQGVFNPSDSHTLNSQCV